MSGFAFALPTLAFGCLCKIPLRDPWKPILVNQYIYLRTCIEVYKGVYMYIYIIFCTCVSIPDPKGSSLQKPHMTA